MSCQYTEPSGSNVNFEIQEYTPPQGDSIVFELCPTTGVFLKVWDGSTFVERPVTYWDGTDWVTPTSIKTYNGTDFV